jgi:hypothetical protein
MIRALPAALVVCAVSACSGAAVVDTCAGTVANAITGTFSVCNDFDQRYRANLDTWSFTADYTELPTSFTWSTSWEVKGEPKVATFDQDTPSIKCDVTVAKSNKTWLARKGAGVPSSGDCSLNLTAVTANEAMGNVTTYSVKGHLTAHLEAEAGTGSTGMVTVELDLCNGDSTFCPPLMR